MNMLHQPPVDPVDPDDAHERRVVRVGRAGALLGLVAVAGAAAALIGWGGDLHSAQTVSRSSQFEPATMRAEPVAAPAQNPSATPSTPEAPAATEATEQDAVQESYRTHGG